MRVFLDTSVLLSACGSNKGASRYVIDNASIRGWTLISSQYCRREVSRNLDKLGEEPIFYFEEILQGRISWCHTTLVTENIVVYQKTKDRPVLLSALAANCDALLTLDRKDFQRLLGDQFYGMLIQTPGDWLSAWRKGYKLKH